MNIGTKMKKVYFILVGIVLIALCFVSCKKNESPDLHFLELKGNVKSVTYYITDDVNSKGKKTRHSQKREWKTYYLNKESQITTIVEENSETTLKRNRHGQITTIYVENPPEYMGGYTISVTWNAKGYPIGEECEMESGGGHTCDITYNEDNEIIEKFYWISWGGDCGTERYKNYTIMQKDERGNWIKRLCETNGRDVDGYYEEYSLEERVITYYMDSQNY